MNSCKNIIVPGNRNRNISRMPCNGTKAYIHGVISIVVGPNNFIGVLFLHQMTSFISFGFCSNSIFDGEAVKRIFLQIVSINTVLNK